MLIHIFIIWTRRSLWNEPALVANRSSTQAQADVGRDLQDLEAGSEPDGDADAPLGLAKRGSVSLHSSPKKMAEAESMEAAEPAAASQARRHRRTVSDMSVLSTTETSSLSSGLGAKYSIGGDSEEWRPAPISIDNLSGADTAQGPATPAKKSVIRFAHVRMNQVRHHRARLPCCPDEARCGLLC